MHDFYIVQTVYCKFRRHSTRPVSIFDYRPADDVTRLDVMQKQRVIFFISCITSTALHNGYIFYICWIIHVKQLFHAVYGQKSNLLPLSAVDDPMHYRPWPDGLVRLCIGSSTAPLGDRFDYYLQRHEIKLCILTKQICR